MKDKVSVLIPDGEAGLALKVLRCLAQIPNIKVSVLSRDQWSPIRFSRHRASFLSHKIESFDENRLDAILRAAKNVKADIILPVHQATIRLIASHYDEVRSVAALPPLSKPDLIDAVADKWRLSNILDQENIPFPKTILYVIESVNQKELESLSYPILAKPRTGAGGTGIMLFNQQSELNDFLGNRENSGIYILQEFIPGFDMGCSVLCQNGEILAYTIQKGIIPGSSRFEPPAGIDFVIQEQVYKNVEKLMRSLNWSGVANIDIRFDERDGQPKILEMNPRFWQSVLGSLIAGVNFPFLACLTSMNINFSKPDYKPIRFIYTAKSYKVFMNRLLSGDNITLDLKNSALVFTWKDPIPEIFLHSSDFIKRLFHNS